MFHCGLTFCLGLLVKKARAKYERANAAWRDAWDMGKAFARTIDELIAEGAFETA